MYITTLIDLIRHNNDDRITLRAKQLAVEYLFHRMKTERIDLVWQLRNPHREPRDPLLSTHHFGFGDATYNAVVWVLYKLNNNNINTGFDTGR